MSKQPLSADELRALIGERDVRPFLNPRNDEFRARDLRTNTPTKDEAISWMAANPNLLRRPLLVTEDEIIYGFDENAYRALAP